MTQTTDPGESAMTEPITIPGYRILRELGAGGMATVYLAIQESFDREVALKVMSPMFNVDPSFATRFVREARIISQIHHASIVPVHDVGEHRRHQYLSMEYLPGGDLKHRLQTQGPDATLALTVCRAIASALELAHRKKFVHRDIKPENILFREDGTPVLTDFGIARAIDSGTSLTRVGTLVGTPAYMSPEQIKGLELDGRTDLYSLGIVLYEMLTGSQPYRADSTLSLALKHISETLPPLPNQFAQFQPVLDRLTARERDERFANGAEALEALNRLDRLPRMNAAPAPVRNPTPYHNPMPAIGDAKTELRELPPVPPPAAPPLLPRSTRLLWIGLGTIAISGAVAMTYMNTRPEEVAGPAKAAAPPAPVAAQTPAPQPTANAVDPLLPLTPRINGAPANEAPADPALTANVKTAPAAKTNAPSTMEPARTRVASAKPEMPMPNSKDKDGSEVEASPFSPSATLSSPLNLADRALWGDEKWRDAAEPDKVMRYVSDYIQIRNLEMFANDLGNGVARFGVRGTLGNIKAQDRLVKLKVELVNRGDADLIIPLDVEIDGEEEEEFEHILDIAADKIRSSPPTRVRVSLTATDQ